MGFGFSDDRFNKDTEKFEYNLDDAIKYQSWSNIQVGLRVRSVLTRAFGSITHIDESSKRIVITWEHGGVSRLYQKDMENAVVVKYKCAGCNKSLVVKDCPYCHEEYCCNCYVVHAEICDPTEDNFL